LGTYTQENGVYPRLPVCGSKYNMGVRPVMKTTLTVTEKSTRGAEARRLRIACLLTQQNVADLAGIPREHVDLLEHNYPVPLDSKRRIFKELWAIKIKR
jgi:DNA-binding XRE family transcriptional regulator